MKYPIIPRKYIFCNVQYFLTDTIDMLSSFEISFVDNFQTLIFFSDLNLSSNP